MRGEAQLACRCLQAFLHWKWVQLEYLSFSTLLRSFAAAEALHGRPVPSPGTGEPSLPVSCGVFAILCSPLCCDAGYYIQCAADAATRRRDAAIASGAIPNPWAPSDDKHATLLAAGSGDHRVIVTDASYIGELPVVVAGADATSSTSQSLLYYFAHKEKLVGARCCCCCCCC